MQCEIVRTGTENWPRFLLVARQGYPDLFWTGSEWTPQKNKGRLFASLPEACQEFERVKANLLGQPPVQHFEAKVTIQLHSHRQLDERQMAGFLNRVAELLLPVEGPIDDSLVQAEIHWHQLRALELSDSDAVGHHDEETSEEQS